MLIYRVSSKRPRWMIMGVHIIFLVYLFVGCGDGELETTNKTGSVAFQVQWEKAGTSLALFEDTDKMADLTELNCEREGVFWVNAIIYDRSYQYIPTQNDPWHCSAHAGTISVSAGSDRRIVIFGKNAANEVLYRGIKSDIDVFEHQITNAGPIVAYYFVPTGGGDTYCYNGEISVYYSFLWQAVRSAASYEIQVATDDSFTSLIVNAIVDDPETDCFPFDYPAYMETDTYYIRARAIDFDGFKSAWSEIWVLILVG